MAFIIPFASPIHATPYFAAYPVSLSPLVDARSSSPMISDFLGYFSINFMLLRPERLTVSWQRKIIISGRRRYLSIRSLMP